VLRGLAIGFALAVNGFCALRSASSRAFSAARLRASASATFTFHIANAYPIILVGLALFACDYHRF